MGQRVSDIGAEIDTRRDAVDVAEDSVPAVVCDEPVEDTAGYRLGILPPIRDDNLGHRPGPDPLDYCSCIAPSGLDGETISQLAHHDMRCRAGRALKALSHE